MTRTRLLVVAAALIVSGCSAPSTPVSPAAPASAPVDAAAIPGLTVPAVQALMRSKLPSGGAVDPSNSDGTQISYLWPGAGVLNIGTGPGGSVTGVSCEDDAEFRRPLNDPFLTFCLDLSYPGADPQAVRAWAGDQIDQNLNTLAVANNTFGGQPWQIDFSAGDVEAVYLTVGFAGTGK